MWDNSASDGVVGIGDNDSEDIVCIVVAWRDTIDGMEIDDTDRGDELSEGTIDAVKGYIIHVTKTRDTDDNDGWNEIIVYIGGVRRDSIELEGKRDAIESRDDVDSREIEKVVSLRNI